MSAEEVCTNAGVLTVVSIIIEVLRIVFIVVPILLIILICIDFAKNVSSFSTDQMKENLKKTGIRVISCIAIFFIPYFVNVLVGLFNDMGPNYALCIKNSKHLSDFIDKTPPAVTIPQTIPNQKKEVTKIKLNKTVTAIGDRSNVVSRNKTYANNLVKLKVTQVYPSTAKNKGVVWSVVKGSQNVKVNQNGEVRGLNGGTAVVRATSKDNPKVYADCKITIVHSLYENVKLTQRVTAKVKYSNKTVTLKKGQKAVLLGVVRGKSGDRTLSIRLKDGTIVTVKRKYLKFLNYYVDDGYSNNIYEEYINNNGFTSKTNYLIWVNEGTQRFILFEKKGGKWKVAENVKTSTGDREGKYLSDGGGSTMTVFNIEVSAFKTYAKYPYLGRAIYMRRENTKKAFGNKAHVGGLPRNTDGGNPSESRPSSHGCPHLTAKVRNRLYNKYNKGSQDRLVSSKVIYY